MSPVAIVTASDSGIGQECAKELAENGFDVGITYRSDEAGAGETLAAVEARLGFRRGSELGKHPAHAGSLDPRLGMVITQAQAEVRNEADDRGDGACARSQPRLR